MLAPGYWPECQLLPGQVLLVPWAGLQKRQVTASWTQLRWELVHSVPGLGQEAALGRAHPSSYVPGQDWPTPWLRQVFRRILDCVSPLKIFRWRDTGRGYREDLARITMTLFLAGHWCARQGTAW